MTSSFISHRFLLCLCVYARRDVVDELYYHYSNAPHFATRFLPRTGDLQGVNIFIAYKAKKYKMEP